MRVLIVGAGGHGQVIADALLGARLSSLEPIGFVDDRVVPGCVILGLPVLGQIACLSDFPHDGIVIAIGDNDVRRTLCLQLEHSGERLVTVVHASAIVSGGVVLEPGAMICAGAIVNTGTRVEKAAIINTGATVDHHSFVGTCAHIAPGVHMGGEVRVGAGALVGIGAVVLPRRTVGRGAVVAAGAVVTRDVADETCVIGAPARVMIRTIP